MLRASIRVPNTHDCGTVNRIDPAVCVCDYQNVRYHIERRSVDILGLRICDPHVNVIAYIGAHHGSILLDDTRPVWDRQNYDLSWW